MHRYGVNTLLTREMHVFPCGSDTEKTSAKPRRFDVSARRALYKCHAHDMLAQKACARELSAFRLAEVPESMCVKALTP